MWTGAGQDRIRCLPAGDGVEAVRTDFGALRFSPHRHDVYTIGLTTHGVQAFRYRGIERRSLPADAFVLHPDELHDGRPGDTRAF
ncbi:MAG: AraC family ligand binding domain-containing protein, partial [Alphaproteobacteria bacterium]